MSELLQRITEILPLPPSAHRVENFPILTSVGEVTGNEQSPQRINHSFTARKGKDGSFSPLILKLGESEPMAAPSMICRRIFRAKFLSPAGITSTFRPLCEGPMPTAPGGARPIFIFIGLLSETRTLTLVQYLPKQKFQYCDCADHPVVRSFSNQ